VCGPDIYLRAVQSLNFFAKPASNEGSLSDDTYDEYLFDELFSDEPKTKVTDDMIFNVDLRNLEDPFVIRDPYIVSTRNGPIRDTHVGNTIDPKQGERKGRSRNFETEKFSAPRFVGRLQNQRRSGSYRRERRH